MKGADIERIQMFGPSLVPGQLVGCEFDPGQHPQVDAQFCARYSVAYGILRGRLELAAYTDEAIREDAEVADLAKRVEYCNLADDAPEPVPIPPDFNAWASRSQGVIVHLKDGRTLRRHVPIVNAFEPTRDDLDSVIAKLRDCARYSGVCDGKRAEELICEVRNLADARSLNHLINLMVK